VYVVQGSRPSAENDTVGKPWVLVTVSAGWHCLVALLHRVTWYSSMQETDCQVSQVTTAASSVVTKTGFRLATASSRGLVANDWTRSSLNSSP
jgi:hypothetical protein